MKKYLKSLVIALLVAPVAFGLAACDTTKASSVKEKGGNNGSPEVTTGLQYSAFAITSDNVVDFSEATVTAENGVATFTNVNNDEVALEGGYINIQSNKKNIKFSVSAELNDGDWIVFAVSVGVQANTATAERDTVLVGMTKKDGELYVGLVNAWADVANAEANSGVADLTSISKRVSNLNDIEVNFNNDYSVGTLGTQTYNTTVGEYSSSILRNLWLVRTNVETVKVTSIKLA